MTRTLRRPLLAGFIALACAGGLAACGSSTPSANSAPTTTSPPPGPGDVAICHLVTQATTAYQAKNYTAWRFDLAAIGNAAGSAHYEPIKSVATQLKTLLSPTTTTTTTAAKHGKKKSKYKPDLSGAVNRVFGPIGGYLQLTKTCAHLPSS